MKRVVLRPYIKASRSAKLLQQWLKENGYPRLKRTIRLRPNRFAINWGSSHGGVNTYINNPHAVKISSNKLASFICFQAAGVSIPDWTTDTAVAQAWIDDGKMVLGRKTLDGHSGQGIIVFESETITSNLVCPLYVAYKKKKKEFRVHVFNGKVLDVQQKKRRSGVTGCNNIIRNHANGWVYCRENLTIPEDTITNAIIATDSLGLVFGAVDVIWNERENRSYVLEVNTAPGLEATTVSLYGNAIKEYINENNT